MHSDINSPNVNLGQSTDLSHQSHTSLRLSRSSVKNFATRRELGVAAIFTLHSLFSLRVGDFFTLILLRRRSGWRETPTAHFVRSHSSPYPSLSLGRGPLRFGKGLKINTRLI
jgi:hypothetical protein